MTRLGGAFWFVLVIATGVTNFIVKQTVQHLDDELANVRRKMVAEQKEIHELSADWTFLNQPELLADLNKRYIGLGPVSPKQVVAGIDNFALRPVAPSPPDVAPTVAAVTPTPAVSGPSPMPAPQIAAVISLEPATPAWIAAATPNAAAPTAASQVAAVIPLEPTTPSTTPSSTPVAVPMPAATPVAIMGPIVKVAAAVPAPAASPASLDALFAQVAGDR